MDRMHLHRRRALRGALATALFAAVAAACLIAPAPARASRYEPVTATVPVEVEVKGDKPSKQLTSTFVMTPAADEEVAPKSDTVTVDGAGEAAFSLAYDEVGEHHYTVEQTTKDADRWTVDRQVYDVTVYCMWNEETDDLFTTVIIRDEDGYKDDTCLFENSYKAPELPSTGDDKPKPEKPKKPAGILPSTGDAAMLPVAAACAVGAVVLGAGVVAYRKRRENN